MAKTWLSIAVELLGGRGEELWPYPGRIFAVGPSHTFQALAEAINVAFARWDMSHLCEFMLEDGTTIVDPAYQMNLADQISGPISRPVDISTAKVARTAQAGDQFQFVYDLGDHWTHQCTVDTVKVDPVEVLGIRPKAPLAYWGWGNMPDQYGRRWPDDDGTSSPPRRPAKIHSMLSNQWPGQKRAPQLDMREVLGAIYNGAADAFRSAITGPDIDDALQQVAAGAPLLLETNTKDDKALVATIINRLNWRGNPGDQQLADDLLARLRNESLAGKALPVDLDMFAELIEGDPVTMEGAYLDSVTGAVFPPDMTDPVAVGDDAIDVESDPERYLWFERIGGRDGWNDMAEFAERLPDAQLSERLLQAIPGKGAFRAFGNLVFDTELETQWNIFSTDRQLGRARQRLADEGIRPV